MNITYKSFLAILLLFSVLELAAQQPAFHNYTIEDGLPDSETYHVMQDSRSYIWIATNSGACRYDGYSFTKIPGLPDNTVLEIYEDCKGRIWFIPLSAKLSYWFKDSLHIYEHNATLLSQCKESVHPIKQSFRVDSSGTVCISLYRNGLFTISPDGAINKKTCSENMRFIREKNGGINIVIRSLVTPNRVADRVFKIGYEDENGSYILRLVVSKQYIQENRSWATRNNKTWFSVGKEVHRIQDSILHKKIDFDSFVSWMSFDSNHNLWISTFGNGAYCYKDGRIEDPPVYHLLEGENTTSVLEDREGGLWISTYKEGLFYFPDKEISCYHTGAKSKNLLNLISDNKQTIWTADNHSSVYKISNGNSTEINLSEYGIMTITSLYFNEIYEGIHAGGGQLIAISDNKVYRYQSDVCYVSSEFRQAGIHTNDIVADNDGSFWFGLDKGLARYKDDQVVYFSYKESNFSLRTLSLAFDHLGNLWLGTIRGLHRYTKGSYYAHNENQLASGRINDIKVDSINNRLWLATGQDGVVVYEVAADTFYGISSAQGLVCDNVNALAIEDNIAWCATDQGLERIELVNGDFDSIHFESWNMSHGLPANKINDVALSDSMVCLATQNGLCVVGKNRKLVNPTPPMIHITGLKILERDTTLKEDYVLEYNKNFISIDYAGLSLKSLGKIQYRYKMEGVENNWVYTSLRNVKYTTLPPGNYTFMIQAANSDGIWTPKAAKIHFVIRQPYWKTWWFISGLSVTGIVLLLFLYLYRERQVKKRNQLKLEVNRHMQKAFSSQMNPHFIFNSLSAIQNYIIKNDSKTSSKYLAKFASLIRIILNNSMNDSVSIGEDIEALQIYLDLEKLRLGDKLQYQIIIDDNIDIRKVKIPPLIIQPFVENSIWHGIMPKENGGEITIRILEGKNYIMCKIQDNGIGRKKAEEINLKKRKDHRSYGAGITKARLDAISALFGQTCKVSIQDLYDDDETATGTLIEIQLPYNT